MLKQKVITGRQLSSRVTVSLGLMVTVCTFAFVTMPSIGTAQAARPDNRAALLKNYGQLPLSFESNQGQADQRSRFIARGGGYGVYLTGQEAMLLLRKPTTRPRSLPQPKLSAEGVDADPASAANPALRPGIVGSGLAGRATEASVTDVIRMQFMGANRSAEPIGEDKLPGTVNYFLGNDPAKWHSAVPTFSRVQYKGIYSGVDLVYYGNQRQLEYDFIVAPRASAAAIHLRFEGAEHIALNADGDLTIAAHDGSIGFHKPAVYQLVDGQRKPVAGAFRLLAGNTIGFRIGRYDHALPLVVDPVLNYSTFFGGSTADFVTAITSDASGNAYVTGLTASEDFPLTAGAFQAINYASPSNGVSTAFVSKFNASGTALLYSTFIGGVGVPGTVHNQGDYGKAITVDASGNAYITGYTYSANFPITSGAFQQTNKAATANCATGFVTKLNASGTALVYSTYLGGSQLEELSGVAIDAGGNAYISGVSASTDYPVTSGAFQTVNKGNAHGGFNLVVTKMNPTGTALLYSTFIGGTDYSSAGLSGVYWTNPIAIDSSGNAYVAGFTTAGDFPVTSAAFQKSSGGGTNVTVSKLNSAGSALVYSSYLGGNTASYAEGLAIDSSGNAYVAGYTADTNFPITTGAFQATNKAYTNLSNSSYANENGFVTKINPAGSALVYSTYLGGTTGPWGGDQIYDLALDTAGDVWVTGSAMSADFPVTANAYQSKNRGATHCCDYTAYTSNAFLTEFNPAGTALLYSTYIGGSGTQNINGPGGFGDTAYTLTLGKNGHIYMGGFTTSSNFPTTPGAFNTTYKTAQNPGFVADFNVGAAQTTTDTDTVLAASANPVVPGTSVTFTATVSPASGTGTPTGNVVFSIDEATVATVALSAGKASYTTTTLAAGGHYVLATYTGSSTYDASGDGFNEYVVPKTPVITPGAGTYYSQQTVTITDATAGAALYYTLDGTTPTVFSTPYTAPILVNYSKTVSAVGVSNHDADSAVVKAAYTIIGSPSVLAAPATAIATPSATLNAFVNTLGIAGTYYFQYGTSAIALTTLTAKTPLTASTTRVQATTKLSTLAGKTTYYYQVVVTTAGGTVAGAVQSFTTN